MDLVVLLVHEHLAHATVSAAQRDSELELADVSLAKPERPADLLRVRIWAGQPRRAHLIVPLLEVSQIVTVDAHRPSLTAADRELGDPGCFCDRD